MDTAELSYPPDLCASCQKITLVDLVDTKQKTWFSPGQKHFPIVYDDIKSSMQTCPLCLLFFRGYKHHDFNRPSIVALSRPEPGYQQTHKRGALVTGLGKAITPLDFVTPGKPEACESPRKLQSIEIARIDGKPAPACGCGYRSQVRWEAVGIAAEVDSYASSFIKRRLLSKEISDKHWQMVRRWLDSCESSHQKCHLGISKLPIESHPTLPTRVVDVGPTNDGSNNLRLLVTSGQRGRYATLSHCWGGYTPVRCTQTTLEAFQDHIDYSLLPRTFQDAIITARKLGVQYLWIDSLCIMQDDKDDWEKESPKMGTIYERACFTIAATSAEDSSAGFLNARSWISPFQSYKHAKPVTVRLPCNPKIPAEGYFFITDQPMSTLDSIDGAHLNQRGWVLQERILSRRIVHFAKDQIYWECRCCFLSEDGGDHTVTQNTYRHEKSPQLDHKSLRFDSVDDRIIVADIFHPSWKKHHDPWRWILEKYTSAKLTHTSDKLPALMGLAERLQTLTPSTYVDGHWFDGSSRLPASVFWTADHSATKAAVTRRPSWSWVSIDGGIRFDARGSDPMAQLLRIEMSTRFGIQNYRSLVLSGKIRGVTSRPPKMTRRGTPIALAQGTGKWRRVWLPDLIPISSEVASLGGVTFDDEYEIPTDMYLVKMFNDDETVLAVEATSEGNEYKRLGIGELDSSGWFDKCIEQTFTLI